MVLKMWLKSMMLAWYSRVFVVCRSPSSHWEGWVGTSI